MRTKRAQNVANGGLDSPKLVWRPGSARTRWGSLQRSPRPPSCIQRGGARWEGGRGREGGKVRDGEEKDGEGEEGRDGEGRGGIAKGGIGPPTFWLLPPLCTLCHTVITYGIVRWVFLLAID